MLEYSVLNLKTEINSEYLGESMFNLLDFTFQIPQDYSYNIFEITKEYIARPDLISYSAYGDTMYTDVICKLNGISNPFELNEGMKLILPTPDDIHKFIIEPSFKDRDDNWGPTQNQYLINVKNKTTKRQANEAIIGDTRFKIDKTNGIIIY